MADSDWKKRVGIEINFSPESSDEEGLFDKSTDCETLDLDRLSPALPDSAECSLENVHGTEEDILIHYFDSYGTTPPRTRIRRKEKTHRDREEQSASKKPPKTIYTMRTKRRNTLDSIYFDDLVEKSENTDSPQLDVEAYSSESSKRNKRSMKLLRGSERDMKHEQVEERNTNHSMSEEEKDRTESLPAIAPQPAIKVESCNRFMSLTSKLVACREKLLKAREKEHPYYQESRLNFYNKIAHLVKVGGCDKQTDKHPWRQLSKEEHMWQNELKDLIWLELQAWHADRPLTEQDEYLCVEREKVGSLLDEIMNYRFGKSSHISNKYTTDIHKSEINVPKEKEGLESVKGGSDLHCCPYIGCLSIYCIKCVENQLNALKDIQQLLNRLEAAEALYPSSKAFASHHPLYKSSGFVGRVKSMCLWYNMTKHHRLKLKILGKHLTFLQSKSCNWPACGEEDSGIATDTSASDDASPHTSKDVLAHNERVTTSRKRVVQFDIDSNSSPSDSNNSSTSQSSDCGMPGIIYSDPALMSASCCCFSKSKMSPVNPYRKYIEEVLKTRGVRKSLYFLDKLHNNILVKSMVSLSKPATSLTSDSEKLAEETDASPKEDEKSVRTQMLCEEDEEEIRSYGYWSINTQSLCLPSYRSAFLFLAHIPLDVVYELLQMRLEQKPDNPSVLCIRQLMRELKEGLRMAALHRERYLHLIRTVLWDISDETILHEYEDVTDFDKACRAVLELYLQYLEKWVPMVQHERFQKNLLEEEWQFVKSTCTAIPGAHGLVGNVFCTIATGMLEAIGTYLISKMKEIENQIEKDMEEETSTKQILLSVCREIQASFNEVRQKSLRAISFTKTIVKDMEKDYFVQKLQDSMQFILSKALQDLKSEALNLRQEISSSLKTVEKICLECLEKESDEIDRIALTSRCREMLHLGYKYSFEFHKEIYRVVTGEIRTKLNQAYISFAYQWMNFVKEWCELGRGVRPRWAIQGLEFLSCVCDPVYTCHLTEEEFEDFQNSVDKCISHVIGTASPISEKRPSSPYIYYSGRGSFDGQKPRSRNSSPSRSASTKPSMYKTSHSFHETGSSSVIVTTQRSLSSHPTLKVNDDDVIDGDGNIESIIIPKVSRIERVRFALKQLEKNMDEKLLQEELIGTVTDICSEDRIHIKSRCVTFSWQRGMKIGQGRFGKVYTAVNNQTGELLAMKEIQLQPNDHRTIRKVAEELRTFEGISHPSLVRYYGVEIHREEMLIFMEFCAEGTLESLVAATESGLPETIIRRFTHQLLEAVCTLHYHGVVHRDIKSANIFLTDEGNSLKLGDFGSAVKIKAHTTMPGELQGFVGTQAYMAPEVFMKNNADGHGRSADIWSVGCVVVEMASGKRPWAEYDSNYQIMFKVGMGETPEVPSSLSEEGQNFVSLCLQHNPRDRATANDLALHSFVKVDGEDDYFSITSILEDCLKVGV